VKVKIIIMPLQWTLPATGGIDALKFSEATLPPLKDDEVEVEMHAASLNYGDLLIVNVIV
jgi:NADPH:quinone reductase-like Zn-dependent oxidoreductase